MAMNEELKTFIKEEIRTILCKRNVDNIIKKVKNRHEGKVHFIPLEYRVFSGTIQSLNIQFGNFIQRTLHNIITNNPKLEMLPESGKKITKQVSNDTIKLIDNYISNCKRSNPDDLAASFLELRNKIIACENDSFTEKSYDVDVLFKNIETGIIYYVEVKYNDDHDTGKFENIASKFIKTYATLLNMNGECDANNFIPILYYFNHNANKPKKSNKYIDENAHIYRGAKLFDELLNVDYSQLKEFIETPFNDRNTIDLFDDIYAKIRNAT
jgi:hypothetical protein